MLEVSCKLSLAFCVLLMALSYTGVKHAEATPIVDSTLHLTDETYKTTHEVNIDDVIDENIDYIRNIAGRLDPLPIENTRIPITKHIYMDLSEGWLQDLEKVRRSGACILKYTSSKTEKVISANLNLGWDSLVFDYRYLIRMMLVHRKGDLHGQLSNLKIHVKVDIDLNSYKLVFRSLDIVSAGKVTLKLEGHPIDKVYNLVIKAATTVLKSMVVNTINDKITEMLQYQKNASLLTDAKSDIFNFVE